jgi:hypothetical protein
MITVYHKPDAHYPAESSRGGSARARSRAPICSTCACTHRPARKRIDPCC